MNNKRVLKLTKKEILTLPGFKEDTTYFNSYTKKQLMEMVIDEIKSFNLINPTVKEYKNANKRYWARIEREQQQRKEAELRKADNDFFNSLSQMKQQKKQQKQSRNEYKQSLKNKARNDREAINDIMNMNPQYEDTKSFDREYYEENIHDKEAYEEFMKSMMKDARNHIGFEVNIGDDSEKQYAFTQVLKYLHKTQMNDVFPIVHASELSGRNRYFTINNKYNVDNMIGHILGNIDVTQDASDNDPKSIDGFQPDSFKIEFVERTGKGKNTKFHGKVRDSETNEVKDEEFELPEEFRDSYDGSFFPYINLSPVDLSCLQIFKSVNKDNYKDCCFVHSCIQSGVFTNDEINEMREIIQTRSLPTKKIREISERYKCHFIVKRIDETYDNESQQQNGIDTRKNKSNNYTRTVKLILFKDHYMFNFEKLPVTTYYLKNYKELPLKFPFLTQSQLQMIRGVNSNGYPIYKTNGTKIMKILRTMFDLNLFRPINQCELDILDTCEFDSHLNDYVELDYNDEFCCELESDETKKTAEWSRVYYADFETDVTVSPHEPYLCCVCGKNKDGKVMCSKFEGKSLASRFLDSLQHRSLTYFHNLKYDACFFINEPGWEVINLMQRSGTVLQIMMTKKMTYKKNGKEVKFTKQLTFRNSYSIIPAPLRNFAQMFGLNVHKEIMAYKLYTNENRNRNILPVEEFYNQYVEENKDVKTDEELRKDKEQIVTNAINAKAYDGPNETIDIMRYAYFYCMKDCVVLMNGMNRFNKDLAEVFKTSGKTFLGIDQYISISAVGYDFARSYGCFNECYKLSGKPQNFIQRCVSGGRTMTARNEKQYVEGRIQDFDAVSLYPSAMSIMNGVPKGKPKVIPKKPNGRGSKSLISHEDLMNYDTFFAEINITKLIPKADFSFGHIFKRNEAGSKLFGNEAVSNYYLDKITLMDLIEFYDVEYELIRGYYFNEGFNNKINDFITHLFNLRLRYKREKNPLEQTIKLLLNSIYGKSILKPQGDEIKVIKRDRIYSYIARNYKFIKEITTEEGITNAYVKTIKPINKHFNLPQFGASVLSWSKHIMNSVISTAEMNGISIYYQDTDSLHLFEEDVERLANIYKEKYGKTLIGKQMTQFHCDFDSFDGSTGEIHSRKLIALGKKSYLDILVDEKGNEGYHIRMKGVPKQVILNHCKRLGISVVELYERMYQGEEMTFDLTDGSNCFRKTKTFNQVTLPQFTRTLKF